MSCHTIENWCNFQRFNTILHSEILLNLVRKLNYFTGQIQLRFSFCTGSTKSQYYIFALATQLASLLTTFYIGFLLSLHSSI